MSVSFGVNRTIAVSTYAYTFTKGGHANGSAMRSAVVMELFSYLGRVDSPENMTPAEMQARDSLVSWFLAGPGCTDVFPSFQLRDWTQPFGLVFVWGWAMDEYGASGAFVEIE